MIATRKQDTKYKHDKNLEASTLPLTSNLKNCGQAIPFSPLHVYTIMSTYCIPPTPCKKRKHISTQVMCNLFLCTNVGKQQCK